MFARRTTATCAPAPEQRLRLIVSHTGRSGGLYFRFRSSSAKSGGNLHLPRCTAHTAQHVRMRLQRVARRELLPHPHPLWVISLPSSDVVHYHHREGCPRHRDLVDVPSSELLDNKRIANEDRDVVRGAIHLLYERLLAHQTTCSANVSVFSRVGALGAYLPVAWELAHGERSVLELPPHLGHRSPFYSFDNAPGDALMCPVRIAMRFEARVAEMHRLVVVCSWGAGSTWDACDGAQFCTSGVATVVVHRVARFYAVARTSGGGERAEQCKRAGQHRICRIHNASNTSIAAYVKETQAGAPLAPSIAVVKLVSLASCCRRARAIRYGARPDAEHVVVEPAACMDIVALPDVSVARALLGTCSIYYRRGFLAWKHWRTFVANHDLYDMTFRQADVRRHTPLAPSPPNSRPPRATLVRGAR